MKIIYLLPPSEGKNTGGNQGQEMLSFSASKPYDIAIRATQKDLKCKDKRYTEAIELNKNILKGEKLSAISRYSGVMYNAIDYKNLDLKEKKYFESHFLILSGMYGVLAPLDTIGNYKLPIETKGLYSFWGNLITDTLNGIHADIIVDFLPNAYKKMIQWENLTSQVLQIDFFSEKNGELKKMTHGVKKVKGEYIHALCKNPPTQMQDFSKKIVQIGENQYHLGVISK